MSNRAKFASAVAKTGGVKKVMDSESITPMTDEEIREQALSTRSERGLSPAELSKETKRRETLLSKMGYSFAHVDDLEPHPENDYSIDQESIANLAASIHETGNTQALLVRSMPNQEKDQILAGERRWHAHKLLRKQYGESWAMVPIRNLGEMTDEDALFMLHSDNMVQRILTPTERAKGFEVIADRLAQQRKTDAAFNKRHKGKKTREILAEQFGVSETTITNELSISRGLSEEGKKLLDEGILRKNEAATIARLPEERQAEVFKQISETAAEAEDVEAAIKEVKSRGAEVKTERATTTRSSNHTGTTDWHLKKAKNALKRAYKCPGEANLALIGEIKQLIKEIDSKQL